jgi:hypothetical protein
MPARTRTKYEADSGEIHFLSLTPDYAAKAGTEPTGAVTNNIRAKVSKSNREYGIKPRGVTLARTIGTAPNTFVKYAFLPLRSKADANSATYALGQTVTIGSVAWEIIGEVKEDL